MQLYVFLTGKGSRADVSTVWHVDSIGQKALPYTASSMKSEQKSGLATHIPSSSVTGSGKFPFPREMLFYFTQDELRNVPLYGMHPHRGLAKDQCLFG